MTNVITNNPIETGLRKNTLGVVSIVFFVIATNGPLTALIGGVPAALTMGNGIGLPGVFLVMGLVYLLFSVGFAAMSTRITKGGAFYTYITAGLGRTPGIGAAFVAIVSYFSLQLALYALFGQFSSQMIESFTGFEIPWWLMCCFFVVLIHCLSSRNIEFNGKILGMLMLSEVAIIGLFDLAVLKNMPSVSQLDITSFKPSVVFSHGFGAAVVFVVSSYMGFETAAVYTEEARNPDRTISRATLIAVTVIMTLYSASVWLLINAWGPNILAAASEHPDLLWYEMASRVMGKWGSDAMSVLMLTSLLAAILSFHNTLSRYFFTLGKTRVLWEGLARLHPSQQTPVMASLIQSILMAAFIVLLGGVLSLPPMTAVMPIAATPAAIGVLTVQIMTAMSVINFFRNYPDSPSLWKRLIAPLLSIFCLGAALTMVILNVSLLTGSEGPINMLVTSSVFMVLIGGYLYASWLRKNFPSRYSTLGASLKNN